MRKSQAFFSVLMLLLLSGVLPAAENAAPPASGPAASGASQSPPAIGEAFGRPVLKEEFAFAYKTTGIFSASGQAVPNDEEHRMETWKHLIFLQEAVKRGLEVPHPALEAELTRLLAEKSIVYGSYNYLEFVKQNFGEDAPTFEKRLVNLLKVKKLLDEAPNAMQDILTSAHMKDYERTKVVTVETSQGTFELGLYPALAPKACENFMRLAEKKYYDGILFHRVIRDFMIQGGDPTASGRGGQSIWGKPFEDEVKQEVSFEKAGLLAMANSGPGTNGSQFFITLAPTPHLHMKHTIFGEVLSGFDVVKKIGDTKTGPDDRPVADQKILHMTVKKWPTSLAFDK